jgi:sugar lactone lactonase YvrE
LAVLLLVCAGAQAQTNFGSQAVGTTSAAKTATVTARAAGQVSSVEVLALGEKGLDFASGGGASTCGSASLTVGGTCTQSVTFTPAAPGLRYGAVVLLDSGNNVLGTAYLAGTGSGPLGVFIPGTMETVAGDGNWESVLDGALATKADLDLPSGVTFDGAGNMYIADSAHNRIRMVTASTGIISTIVGNGNPAYTGDNGPAAQATVNTPSGITVDGAGNIYIADTNNNVIRKISAATGKITTVAGNHHAGNIGDKGLATSAELNAPWGVTIDAAGNLYIADTSNHEIRRVDASTGIITTVAGDGFTNPDGSGGFLGDNGQAVDAELNYPHAVAFDATGNMYIPDSANNRIREVDTAGVITTYAGTGAQGFSGDTGLATDAELYSPSAVAIDPAGNLYIGDTQNNRVRKVSSLTGNIDTIAGNGIGKFTGDDGPATAAGIYGPYGLYLDGFGNLFIADYFDHRIREDQANLSILTFSPPPVRQGSVSAPQPQTVENDGNAPFDVTAITPDKNAAVDATLTTCNVGAPFLAVDLDCVVSAEFAPTVAGNPLTGMIDVIGNTDNTPLVIEVVGDATAVNSTTVTLTSSVNPSTYGQGVTFTATVTSGQGTGALTGTVEFFDGTTAITGQIGLSAAGVATYTTASLAVGSHGITAVYSGDEKHFPGTSNLVTQIVNEATATNLVSSSNPSAVGQNVTFTATVTTPHGGGVVPDGQVVFSDGATILASVVLGANGKASYSTATLINGLHVITAAYGGDAAKQILASTSAPLDQEVQAPSSTALTSNLNPSTYGLTVTFTTTVTPNGIVAPTGVVDIIEDGVEIGNAVLVGTTGVGTFQTSSLTVGSHIMTAKYRGSPSDASSFSTPITEVVDKTQTQTTVEAVPNPGFAGSPVAITATVQVTLGAARPTGTVTFTDNGATIGTASLDSAERATINPTLAAGQHSIVASYAGDTDDEGSVSSPLSLPVVLGSTKVAVTPSADPVVVLSPVTFTATVTGNAGTPSGNVEFFADGVSLGIEKLNATGSASVTTSGLTVGHHAINANYQGNGEYSPGTSPTFNEQVLQIPTITDLGTSASSTSTQAVLVATVIGTTGPTPTGNVSFKIGGREIGGATLDSSGVATLTPNLPTGTYSVIAVYGGDALHSPSTSAPVTISGVAEGFNLTVSPASVSIPTKDNKTVTVTLTSIGGYTDTIGLGCASLPASVNCHFSNYTVTLAANAVQTVQLTIDTNDPLSGGPSAMNSPPGSRGVYLAGMLLPISALFGLLFLRFRRRYPIVLNMVLVLILSGAGLMASGCGGFTQISAKPGNYVIQVTGIGSNSDITHYQNVTLDITQ